MVSKILKNMAVVSVLSFPFIFTACSSESEVDRAKEDSYNLLKQRIDRKMTLCRDITLYDYDKIGALKSITYKDSVIDKTDENHRDKAYVSYNVDFENFSTIIVVPLWSKVEFKNGRTIKIDGFVEHTNEYQCGEEAKKFYNVDKYSKLVS